MALPVYRFHVPYSRAKRSHVLWSRVLSAALGPLCRSAEALQVVADTVN